jgi:hypothetical protein
MQHTLHTEKLEYCVLATFTGTGLVRLGGYSPDVFLVKYVLWGATATWVHYTGLWWLLQC